MNSEEGVNEMEAKMEEVRAGPQPSRTQAFVQTPPLTPASHIQLPLLSTALLLHGGNTYLLKLPKQLLECQFDERSFP